MKEFVRRFGALVLMMTLLLTAGCSSNQEQGVISNGSKPTESTDTENSLTPEEQQAEAERREAFATSTAENDTDVGLKTIKVDTAEQELSEKQKTVIKYFDTDYLDINYEFARRYPMVFQDAQVSTHGTVSKVLSQSGSQYELLLWVGILSDEDADDLICLRGESSGALLMEGDRIVAHGHYEGVETMEVDGRSLTIPVVEVYDTYYSEYMGEYHHRFDIQFIKNVAESVFGDVDVRKYNAEEIDKYVGSNFAGDNYLVEEYYVVDLENQSNSKFSKFYISSDGGQISDESIFSYKTNLTWLEPSSIMRFVEFSGDLQHFYIISYNWDLRTFTIECYDQQLNKTWKREFEEVEISDGNGLIDRMYDYTKNNFYVVINNELYVLDATTGENTFTPTYVGGNKIAVNKLSDGILLIGYGKADTIMKIDLTGQMIWKTNTSDEVFHVETVQANGENLVIEAYTYNSQGQNTVHFYVVDNETGAMVVDAVELQ